MMDFGWDGPPEEDFDAMLEDEEELEYIREMEKNQDKLRNVEQMLEGTADVSN